MGDERRDKPTQPAGGTSQAQRAEEERRRDRERAERGESKPGNAASDPARNPERGGKPGQTGANTGFSSLPSDATDEDVDAPHPTTAKPASKHTPPPADQRPL
jgi:hypothetical protein